MSSPPPPPLPPSRAHILVTHIYVQKVGLLKLSNTDINWGRTSVRYLTFESSSGALESPSLTRLRCKDKEHILTHRDYILIYLKRGTDCLCSHHGKAFCAQQSTHSHGSITRYYAQRRAARPRSARAVMACFASGDKLFRKTAPL